MNQLTDEQIQQLLDEGAFLPDRASADDRKEARIYKQLFDELHRDLPIRPNADFSLRVMSRVDALQPKPARRFSYGWLILGMTISLVAGLLVIASFEEVTTDLMNVLVSLRPFKWALIFGLGSLFLLQWLDLKLIREPSLPKLTH